MSNLRIASGGMRVGEVAEWADSTIKLAYIENHHFCLSMPIDAKNPDLSRFSTNELSKKSLGLAILTWGNSFSLR